MRKNNKEMLGTILLYDEHNPLDIERYAKKLIGKTFNDVLSDYYKLTEENQIQEDLANYGDIKGKGKLGNLIEKFYFFYEPNSDSRADFHKAGTELKVTPYLKKNNGELKAKERLVIGMIPNNEPVEVNFEKSHVLEKLKLILLILYFHENNKNKLDYKIDYVKLFSILGQNCINDLEIIKEDYRIIVEKIISGNAHKLSEGDTKYLGACTKGATASKSLQRQYYSDIPAKRRAFSLKQSYMSYVLNTYIAGNVATYEPVIKNRILKDKDFESIILEKINSFKGQKLEDLYRKFKIDKASKQMNNILVCRILGVKTDNAEEFAKANIKIKTIRLEKNNKPEESMSFPTIKIKEFVKEEFEDSEIYEYFSETRFLFVIFKKDSEDDYKLIGAKFWNMPIEELEGEGQKEWLTYQNKFKTGINFQITAQKDGKKVVKNDLPKTKDTRIFHLRPRADKSKYLIKGIEYGKGDLLKDTDELLNGDRMTKQCFWLNKDYVVEIIRDLV